MSYKAIHKAIKDLLRSSLYAFMYKTRGHLYRSRKTSVLKSLFRYLVKVEVQDYKKSKIQTHTFPVAECL